MVKRSLFQTSYTMFSKFCIESMCIESYFYITAGQRVLLEIQIVGLSSGFDSG